MNAYRSSVSAVAVFLIAEVSARLCFGKESANATLVAASLLAITVVALDTTLRYGKR